MLYATWGSLSTPGKGSRPKAFGGRGQILTLSASALRTVQFESHRAEGMRCARSLIGGQNDYAAKSPRREHLLLWLLFNGSAPWAGNTPRHTIDELSYYRLWICTRIHRLCFRSCPRPTSITKWGEQIGPEYRR